MDYDLLILGGGSAGYNGASTASGLGLRVGLVEAGPDLGGLCILRGCMPSKTLLESAHRYDTLRRAGEFGLSAGEIGFCRETIRERKERLVAEFADYRARQLQSGRFDFHRARAAFVDPHTVELTAPDGSRSRLTARTFLLATGSDHQKIDLPGLDECGALNSDDVLDFRGELPASLIILGGGATAVEFAWFYAVMGVEVTLIQRGRQLLKSVDRDVAECVEASFRKRGIRVYTHTELLKIETGKNGKRVTFRQVDQTITVEAEAIFAALGREPNTGGLALEKAGVAMMRGHLQVLPTQQTSVPHIFAAGDVAGPYEIVHIAIQQAEVAVRNAARWVKAGRDDRTPDADRLEEIDYRVRLSVVFGHPEVAVAGLTERELSIASIPYRVASYLFADHGKAMVAGEEEGFVKLLVSEESGEIVGAAVVGAHASELIHEVAVAMRFRATAADLAAIPHYHPTLSEIWTYPAEELA
ncbi:MAG TPA: NAD(P)/FAD-dependent oxidoreductase [Chthoniobacteraceae bacterium]|nr:NAD(P)/FAD-dependent oxidoreductase [Chthoniobacteraceae bacterium]